MKTSAAAREPCKATLRTMSHPVEPRRRSESTRFSSFPLSSIDPQSHKNGIWCFYLRLILLFLISQRLLLASFRRTQSLQTENGAFKKLLCNTTNLNEQNSKTLCAYVCLQRCVDPLKQTPAKDDWRWVFQIHSAAVFELLCCSLRWVFNSLQTAACLCLRTWGCRWTPALLTLAKWCLHPLIHGIINPDVLGWTDGGTEEGSLISDLHVLMLPGCAVIIGSIL